MIYDLQSKCLKRSAKTMIIAFINPEPLWFLASNFEKSTEYCNHSTIASIQILNVDWTNEQYIKC